MSKDNKCIKCKKIRSPEDFIFNPETGRSTYLCRSCRELKDQIKPWDWACAMLKFVRMQVAYHRGALGQCSHTLDENILRALLILQNQRCLLSAAILRIPSQDELKALSANRTGQHVTLSAWEATLTTDEKQRAPVLVRVDPALNWIPGNVALICNFLLDMYTRTNSLPGFRNYCCRLIETSKVMQPVTAQDLEMCIKEKGETLNPRVS